jgi:ribosomal protein L19
MLREDELNHTVHGVARVNLHQKKRNTFYKLGYNENHIPALNKKKRKPRLEAWDNPETSWPPKLPRAHLHKGKTLLNHLDSIERQKIETNRNFEIPNYRTGDVVKISKIFSLSEKKEDDVKGVVIHKSAVNSIRSTCKVNLAHDGCNIVYSAKLFSPHVTNMTIEKYGSNYLRRRLTWMPKLDLSAGRLQEPIVRGK